MITFTISSFLLTICVVILAGFIFGAWLIFTEEERDKQSMKQSIEKHKEKHGKK